jgi:hypothetical protein
MATDINDPIGLAMDSTGDIEVLTTGAGAGIRFTKGVEAVTQNIEAAVSLFRGEWFLDLERGVPYYQEILGQRYSQETVLTAFRDQILTVPNVDQILTLTSSFDGATRTTTVSFEVLTPFGTTSGSVTI